MALTLVVFKQQADSMFCQSGEGLSLAETHSSVSKQQVFLVDKRVNYKHLDAGVFIFLLPIKQLTRKSICLKFGTISISSLNGLIMVLELLHISLLIWNKNASLSLI